MSSAAGTPPRRGRIGGIVSGLAVALGCLLFLGGFAWAAVIYRPYTVPTESMSPTIQAGDRVLGQRLDHPGAGEIHRGDVVVFKDQQWGDLPMVKRVVGIGGDEVACCTRGALTVNGKRIDEPYLRAGSPASATGIKPTKVPEGRLFLLGDERSGSLDSSVHLGDGDHGSVSVASVQARVDAHAWPLKGMLERPEGFAHLPGGISEPGPLPLQVGGVIAGMVLILGGAAYGPVARRFGRRRAPAAAGRG